jgi:hypothetical protein
MDGRERTGRLLAAREVVESFDPLPLAPAAVRDLRDWVLESQAAAMLGLTKRALERRRQRGTGPAHHRRMGLTCYYIDELDRWAASGPRAYRRRGVGGEEHSGGG